MNILIGLLIITGIYVLIRLAILLSNLSSTVKKVDKIVQDNKRSIDITILETSKNLEQSAELLKTLNMKEREIRETLDNVDTITTNIAKVTTTTSDAIEKVETTLENVNESFKMFSKFSSIFKGDDKSGK